MPCQVKAAEHCDRFSSSWSERLGHKQGLVFEGKAVNQLDSAVTWVAKGLIACTDIHSSQD